MFKFNGTVKGKMSLETMATRLAYNGGRNQQHRMIRDKERSLKKALLYSYQAGTAVLQDGREFRCLMNPDKTKMDYDTKIISIPYRDICLNQERYGTTTQGQQIIGMKGGDVFHWKETNSDWIVYLEDKEELAYFRAEVRRCDYTLKINGHKYKVYIRGPVETKIDWNQKKGVSWNDINYTLDMIITKNEETLEFFERFKKIKFDGRTWETQVVDRYGGDGVLELGLKEDFNNEYGPDLEAEIPKEPIEKIEKELPQILGESIVYPFDERSYTINNAVDGTWEISDTKLVKIIESDDSSVSLEIKSRVGEFDLIYKRDNELDVIKHITIKSL